MKLIVGSRGSKLALAQTQWVIDQLKEHYRDLVVDIEVIKTKGDRIQNVSLNKIGGKGVFVKEIEAALLDGSIDFAVHSMKDMPSEIPEELVFAPSPIREDPRDVIVTKHLVNKVQDLPQGAVIGTGSKRRKFQLLEYRSDLKIVDIRGNIDTRINKMLTENLDGIVLAAAGINRLGFESCEAYRILPLDKEVVIPSPGQGILGIQVHVKRPEVLELFRSIAHYETNIQSFVERDFLKTLNGSCHVPIGAYCEIEDEDLIVRGIYGDEDGKKISKKVVKGSLEDKAFIGSSLAKALLEEVKD
ncbi:hydroxymethylbilane synthase [Natranaerovirga pectinivora]|uniref:Porphobilinogen deaminase n=1 Tax=Natranaerovirga pectinivora TaxID=682400 RepID=A0A4R3MJF8_9FIRM|nr:hydroxymethylbilane synthase [Natranaerovirga pectinivora]TCT14250.1 hydroxymethylbilane synthase [Natranaerovirga pectinivora]